ncbi:MAG: DUF1016 family protein [Butyrivibrio sp.]|nr:DUF1016 family protein [Butyrivibrio sp.]
MANLPQAGVNSESLVFNIPWGHNKLIIDKCKGNTDKALFFVKETMDNTWSRAVLMNFLDTDLYERQGKAVTNFKKLLPPVQSDLAQEMTRDPYNFDFLTIRKNYDEKELKDALMEHVQSLLMELGEGFAFVGREYRLVVGETEQFIDLLFYNVLAQYAVNMINVPIGISEYKLSNVMPEEFKSSMPTIEEIENELKDR